MEAIRRRRARASGRGGQQNHVTPLLTHAHSLYLTLALALPRSRRYVYHAHSLPPPHHHALHLAHSSAIISSTSPKCLCHHLSSGEATVRVCRHRAIVGAPPSLRLPWPCSTEPSRSRIPLIRVRLELGLTQGKSLRPMPASSEQNAAVPPLRSLRHAAMHADKLRRCSTLT